MYVAVFPTGKGGTKISRFALPAAIDLCGTGNVMTAISITPLRKRKVIDGKLYERPPVIEAQLLALSILQPSQISERCGITDAANPDYLHSECLMYLARAYRLKPLDDCAEDVFKALLGRLLTNLPTGETADGDKVKAFESDVSDFARDKFLTMLMMDREEYVENLDMYEVRFNLTIATLRANAFRDVGRSQPKMESIEIDMESGDVSPEVERAAGSFDPFVRNKLDDPLYEAQLYRELDALTPLQRAILEFDRNGMLDESKDPNVLTISGLLKKSPKTIRAHRALALSALHEALTKGEPR